MRKEQQKDQFLELMDFNKAIIHKICRIYTSNKDEYMDLYQEILMQSWHSFPNFNWKSKFSTWLYKVSLNTALTEFRKNRRRLEHLDSLSTEQQYLSQEDGYEKEIEILYRAIEALNPLDKAIILLYLEESSYNEMAEIIGISVNLVGVRLKRAKERLERILKKFA